MTRTKAALAGIWLFLAALPSAAFAQAGGTCVSQGYMIAYFNGMNSTQALSNLDMAKLRSVLPATHNGRQISIRLMYNQTLGVRDFLEVFRQLADEADPSGLLARRSDILMEALRGRDDQLQAYKKGASPAVVEKMDTLKRRLSDELYARHLLPETVADYQNHNTQLLRTAQARYRILLVGYSQGALFANQAYSYLRSQGVASVGAAYIAPASNTLFGSYILSKQDKVINELLRGRGYALPPASDDIPAGPNDPFGHSITETYLAGASGKVSGMILGGLSSLSEPLCRVTYRYEGDPFNASYESGLYPGRLVGTFTLAVPSGYNGVVTHAESASLTVEGSSGTSKFVEAPMDLHFSMTLNNGVPVAWKIYMAKGSGANPSGPGTFLTSEYAELISNGRNYNTRYYDLYGRQYQSYGFVLGSLTLLDSSIGLSGSAQLGKWSTVATP